MSNDFTPSTNDFTPSTNDFLSGADVPPNGTCTVPPSGWWCSRKAGHPGPCAAREAIRADYTPTTESIRYLATSESTWLFHQPELFDRWLAAHDAEIRAESA